MSRYSQRAIIAERKKLVQKLEAELERIWTAKLTPQYIILPKPIRDGWFKTLRLRDDIKRSRKAKTYQEVLDAVVVDVWGSKSVSRNYGNLRESRFTVTLNILQLPSSLLFQPNKKRAAKNKDGAG